MEKERFVEAVGWVYEHSSWIAERAWCYSPYSTIERVNEAMNSVIKEAAYEELLELIRAHPVLGAQVQMSESSQQEQKKVGLDNLTQDEEDLFSSYNSAYVRKYGFPFILAIRGKSKEEILDVMRQRLLQDPKQEIREALQEISKIAWLRLKDTVTTE